MSLLEQEHQSRGWSRAKVEAMTGIPPRSLENWEKGNAFPRYENVEILCKLYSKDVTQLGLTRLDNCGIVQAQMSVAETTIGEEYAMSDLIRRQLFSNLGSRLTSLIDLWPRRNYRYEELQAEMNKAIFDTHVVGDTHDSLADINRREALKSVALLPLQLVGGIALISTRHVQKTDNDLLLKRCAAGITACWYLRRGKELAFVSDLLSTYISLLEPFVFSRSEAHQKAAARLLAQSFMLKSKLTNALQDDDKAIVYEEQAIQYALMAESVTEQAIANREMSVLYWKRKKYKLSLPYAETAYGLAKSNKDTPKIIISFTASGLANCQASSGYLKEAQISLKEAHDFFDSTIFIPSMPYGEAILTGIDAWICQHMGNFKEAINSFKRYKALSTTVLGVIEGNIEHAKIEVSRDDRPRNMDLCVKLLTEAVTGAKELDSKRYVREAREVCDMLRLAWPREKAVKDLRELF